MSIKIIDYKTFTINTNIILLFNNVFSKLFYTISFINYCNCYKLYTQCWPYQIFVHGALHELKTPVSRVDVLLNKLRIIVSLNGFINDELMIIDARFGSATHLQIQARAHLTGRNNAIRIVAL